MKIWNFSSDFGTCPRIWDPTLVFGNLSSDLVKIPLLSLALSGIIHKQPSLSYNFYTTHPESEDEIISFEVVLFALKNEVNYK